MRKIKRTILALNFATFALILGACAYHSEGPLERTGKHLDRAAERTGEAASEAGEAVLAPLK